MTNLLTEVMRKVVELPEDRQDDVARGRMPLTGKSVLIVDHRVGRFIVALSATLERLGAEVLVALDVGKALEDLKRFDFSACLIGSVVDPPES
mgnify:CR=1 FL=1